MRRITQAAGLALAASWVAAGTDGSPLRVMYETTGVEMVYRDQLVFTQDGRGLASLWLIDRSVALEGVGTWFHESSELIAAHFDNPSWGAWVHGVSADGRTIAGSYFGDVEGYGDVSRAAVWSVENGLTVLGVLGVDPRYPDWTASFAFGTTADAHTLVGQSSSQNGEQAFVWTQEDGMTPLGDHLGDPGLGSFSRAVGIERTTGAVLGSAAGEGGRLTLFRWTPLTGMVDLTPDAKIPLDAERVSPGGSAIMGYTSVGESDPGPYAFVWTEQSGLRLVPPPPGAAATLGNGLSDDGLVCVGVYRSRDDPAYQPYISTPESGSMNFDDFLRDVLALDARGWSGFYPTSVSADGKYVAGSVIKQDDNGPGQILSAFVLDITPPCRMDLDRDGALTFFDVGAFLTAYNAGDSAGDFDQNGSVTPDDVWAFVDAFAGGCP